MENLMRMDSQQIFTDWGVDATLEEVTSFYDPDTGCMEESIASTPIKVLAGAVQSSKTKNTVANDLSQKIIFVVQSDDFPQNVNLNTARIHFRSQSYAVETISHSHLPDTVALETEIVR